MHTRLPHAPVRSRQALYGFTLIELLVVITIIVVLLALLVPALDKAIYQAELVMCSANQDAMATGVTVYAFDHKRTYPYRDGVDRDDVWYRPYDLYNPSSPTEGRLDTLDLRLRLREYVPYKMYLDPLAGQVDLSPEATDADSQVLSSYTMLFGFKYDGYGGMTRIGGKLRWRDFTYDVLVAETQHYARDLLMAFSHPDSFGVLRLSEVQNGSGDLVAETTNKMTYTLWDRSGNPEHGSLDMNYAFQDGSVSRIAVPEGVPDLNNVKARRNDDYPLKPAPFISQRGGAGYGTPDTIWIPGREY